MKPKILVAVDGSTVSAKAVEHAGEILRGSPGCEVTLFHVAAIPPMFLEHGGSEDGDKETRLGETLAVERERWVEKCRERVGWAIFAPAKRILKDKGVRENGTLIQTKLAAEGRPDVARAICREAEEGRYDAVVVGRKRHSRLRELLFGCVCEKVIHNLNGGCQDHAIWIVE